MRLFQGKRPKSTPPAHAPVTKAPPATADERAPTRPRPISVGLQGGGAHGAFEWGVLDRLLEVPELEVKALTAASAGAMNAVVLAAGLAGGDGPRGGQAALERFWRGVNQAGGRNVFGDSGIWTAAFNPQWVQSNPFYRYFEGLLVTSSPYEFNPFNLNPLREVLREAVDFEAVRQGPLSLFIAATDVSSGKIRIFTEKELSEEAVLASAALPYLFQAVEVEGRAYWDGGYLANPPLWPLFYAEAPQDVLIVMLNPLQRQAPPRSAGEIMDRLNEITFNAALSAELRSVAFVQKLFDEGLLNEAGRGRYKYIRTHAILADDHLGDLPLSSKFDTEWSFLLELKARGRRAAEAWLKSNLDAVGVRSSLDIRATFL